MHELGVICSVLKTLEGIMEEEHLTHIEKIVLQVGELSGMIPSYVQECFPAATYKTKFEQLQMEMEVVEGIVLCNRCGEKFNGYRHNLKCPKCGAEDLTPLSGREFIIKEIHGY